MITEVIKIPVLLNPYVIFFDAIWKIIPDLSERRHGRKAARKESDGLFNNERRARGSVNH
jgi:hypothetical protein